MTLRPIYVFFGALEACPTSGLVETVIFIGKVMKKTIHQIKINKRKFVNKYI